MHRAHNRAPSHWLSKGLAQRAASTAVLWLLLSDTRPIHQGSSIMTRSDLVNALAERFSQLTHRDTEYAVKTLLEAMADALAKGHRIEIRGFGSFSVTRRPPRTGRNPRSGALVSVPEKRVPHFKAGKALREDVCQALGDAPAAPTTAEQAPQGRSVVEAASSSTRPEVRRTLAEWA